MTKFNEDLPQPKSKPDRSLKFSLGQVVATPGALSLLNEQQVHPIDLLERHVRGDWGSVCVEDAQSNDWAVQKGERLLSSYSLGSGLKVWIITESDRSVTTLLLPEEY